MKYIVKIGVLKGEEGYAYSVWIETEYGAVIDMWSDYVEARKLKEVYSIITGELFKMFNRIMHEDSIFLIYVDNVDFKDYLNNIREYGIALFYRETANEELSHNMDIAVDVVDFPSEGRVYSLAMMALDQKKRYPPVM